MIGQHPERDRLVAEEIARLRVFQLGHGAKVAGPDLGHVGRRLSLQKRQVAEPLGDVAREVVQRRVRLHGAGDDPEHRDPSGERIRDRLPHEDRGRATVGRLHGDALVGALRGGAERPLRRRRHEGKDCVEQRLHADVRHRRGADEREDPPRGDAALESVDQFLLRESPGLEELLHQGIVGFGDHLDERVARGLCLGRKLVGYRPFRRLAAAVGRKRPALQRDEIDDAAEVFLLSDRNLHRNHRAAEDAAQRVEGAAKVGSLTIETAQDDEPRRVHFGRDAPDLLGRHLHSGDGVHDHERGVRHAQSGARIAEKVGHARGVDEVDLGAVPLDVGEAGGQGVLAGDLFLVVVGDRRAVVDAAEAVDSAGIEEQRGEQLRLAGAAMTD